MSVTPSQFPTINQSDLDGTETLWAQKGGIDYSLSLDNIKQYGGCDVYCTSLVIPTASVLTLFATPIEIVAAPGVGYAIDVISATAKITYNSVAYATNTVLNLIYDGSTQAVLELAGASPFLAATSTLHGKFFGRNFSNASNQIIENAAVKVSVQTGNPTAGDSGIKVYVQYRIITI